MSVMNRLLQFCSALVLAGAALPSLAATIVPTEYVAEGSNNVMRVTPGNGGKLNFSVEIFDWTDTRMCSAEGEIVGNKAVLRRKDMAEDCIVTFLPDKNYMEVRTSEACSKSYCKEESGFDGFYERFPGCTIAERAATRKQFRALYDKKDYAAAMAKLDPVLVSCRKALSQVEQGWIRNDLALVQLKLGLADRCLATLKPLAGDADKSDEELAANFANCQGCKKDMLAKRMPMIRATRTNLRLCRDVP